jgi:hypothetical protein
MLLGDEHLRGYDGQGMWLGRKGKDAYRILVEKHLGKPKRWEG